MTNISVNIHVDPETPIKVADLYKDAPGETITVKIGGVTAFFSRADLLRLNHVIGLYFFPEMDAPSK